MRKSYIDTLKLFAAFHIFASHFIYDFHREYMAYFEQGRAITLLNGLSGKLCVAFFGICLGYFAYMSREKNPTIYVLKRYFYFFFCGFLINSIISIYRLCKGWPGNDFFIILITSLRLSDRIFDTYWCIPAFFIASLISYANGKANVSGIVILFEIVFLYLIDETWIAICLMGSIVAVIMKSDVRLFSSRVVRITMLILMFFAIKRPENAVTYFVDGLCSAAFLLVVENSPFLQKILRVPFFTNQGKYVMAIYLIHPLTYTIIGNYLMHTYFLPYGIRFLVTMIICWIIIVLISCPLTFLINKAMYLFDRHIIKFVKET